MNVQMGLPMPGRSRLGDLKEACRAVFKACPGGKPRSADDLVAILALAWMGAAGHVQDSDVDSALSNLVFSGVGAVAWKPERALALCRLAATKWLPDALSAVDAALARHQVAKPVDLMETIQGRVEELWVQVQSRRSALVAAGLEVQERLVQLLPENLRLDPHQAEAVAFIEQHGWKALLADDMGIGKTVSALCSMLIRGNAVFPVVVVCPVSVLGMWMGHAQAWLAKMGPTVLAIRKTDDVPKILPSRAFMVTSWHTLSTSPRILQGKTLGCIVGDESQYLANHESGRTRAFWRLRTSAPMRLLLSGTPDPNGRAREYWAQLKALDPDSVPPFRKFGHAYCGPETIFIGGRRADGKPRTTTRFDGTSNPVGFAHLLDKWRLRRVKAEFPAGFLPPKTRYVLKVSLTVQEEMNLESARDEVRGRLEARALEKARVLRAEGAKEDEIARAMRATLQATTVAAFGRLRQEVGLIKAERSIDLMADLAQEKRRVVVFAYYQDVAERARAVYTAKFGPDSVLFGADAASDLERTRAVARWESGEASYFVVTERFHAGVTLVSSADVAFLDRFWSPFKEAQAEDRSWRRGQTRDVSIWYFTCPGTVDDAVGEIVTWKETRSGTMQGSIEERAMRWLGLDVERLLVTARSLC